MDRKDFDPEIIELVDTYANIIQHILVYKWNISLEDIGKDEEKNVEFVKSQLIFFLVKAKRVGY